MRLISQDWDKSFPSEHTAISLSFFSRNTIEAKFNGNSYFMAEYSSEKKAMSAMHSLHRRLCGNAMFFHFPKNEEVENESS